MRRRRVRKDRSEGNLHLLARPKSRAILLICIFLFVSVGVFVMGLGIVGTTQQPQGIGNVKHRISSHDFNFSMCSSEIGGQMAI